VKIQQPGFRETFAAVRGELSAATEYERAKLTIHAHLRSVGPPPHDAEVDAYLQSEYGGLMARDALNKNYVKTQLQDRPARFLKHFLEVRRRLLNCVGETL
jgi:hypothetical protein